MARLPVRWLTSTAFESVTWEEVAATVIGNDEWDLVALVDYPSAQAGHDMVTDPEYPLQMRADARVDSRLYCTRPV